MVSTPTAAKADTTEKTLVTNADGTRHWNIDGRIVPFIAGGDETADETDIDNAAGDNTDTGTDNNADGNDTTVDNPAAVLNALQAERTERKQLAKQVKALTEQIAAKDRENLPELDQVKQQLADITAERDRFARDVRKSSASAALIQAATAAKAISASGVARIAMADLDAVEFDDDGTVTNAAQLIAGVKAAEPGLFAARNGSGDAGKGGNDDNASANKDDFWVGLFAGDED